MDELLLESDVTAEFERLLQSSKVTTNNSILKDLMAQQPEQGKVSQKIKISEDDLMIE